MNTNLCEKFSIALCFLQFVLLCSSNDGVSDITKIVFGDSSDGIIGAFGDFNSDELTDVFIVKNEGKTLEVLLGSFTNPLLKRAPNLKCDFHSFKITSVIPGDFDGDAFMDLLITTKRHDSDEILDVYVNWGGSDRLNCTEETQPLVKMYGEPLALDYNKDMIIDLFGLDENQARTFWVFNNKRETPIAEPMILPKSLENSKLNVPHSHAYLDLNNDFTADLFITAKDHYEVWHGLENEGFKYNDTFRTNAVNEKHLGQTLFLDIELTGTVNLIVPICFDSYCQNSTILVRIGEEFHDLRVNFKDSDNQQWGFVLLNNTLYTNTITMRGGDFNMDGYPDLLVTLSKQSGQPQTFLLENVPCPNACGKLTRKFEIKWKALAPFSNGTVMGAFYDFYQDGILDVIFVEENRGKYRQVAFRNTLDYDANFVKVIVLTGLENTRDPTKLTPLGKKKRTYGTNLPGPRIAYHTTTQDGAIKHGSSVQMPQSAYFSLHLPYTIFGLGRTPNFVDALTVGLSNRSRTWTQLIPNSQMIVVPWPPEEPSRWKAQLFVTPSKLILMSVVALGGTCLIIMLTILVLHIKEKREDKIEKLQEAHRFHFDAM